MKVSEIVAKILKAKPTALSGVSDAKAAQMTRAVLTQFKRQLDSVEAGVESISYLGKFNIKRIERKAPDGKVVSVRRVVFSSTENK